MAFTSTAPQDRVDNLGLVGQGYKVILLPYEKHFGAEAVISSLYLVVVVVASSGW